MHLVSCTHLLFCVQELPAELCQLPSLAELDLRNNKLAALPPSLGDAGSLGELRLGFNKISSLPPTLGMLRSLKTLDLRNNVIEVCAAELQCVQGCGVCVLATHTCRGSKHAGGTRQSCACSCLCNCECSCVLCLQELPDALCGLPLVLLDLTNNCLRRLPAALGHMTTLRSIPLVRGCAGAQHLRACHACLDSHTSRGCFLSGLDPPCCWGTLCRMATHSS